MSNASHVRNCYLLCQSVLRNAAYYRGAASLGRFEVSKQFAVVVRNNFLDMTFLDWCKIFVDKKGKHNWRKIFLLSELSFESGLLMELGINSEQFNDFLKSVAHYRDKVIAHADIYNVIAIPKIDFIVSSTIYLYNKLRDECGLEPNPVAPHDLYATFTRVSNEGANMFEKLVSF